MLCVASMWDHLRRVCVCDCALCIHPFDINFCWLSRGRTVSLRSEFFAWNLFYQFWLWQTGARAIQYHWYDGVGVNSFSFFSCSVFGAIFTIASIKNSHTQYPNIQIHKRNISWNSFLANEYYIRREKRLYSLSLGSICSVMIFITLKRANRALHFYSSFVAAAAF